MLQLRSRWLPIFASRLEALRDRLMETDPGRLRLYLSVRGTLSVFMACVLALAAGRLLGFPPVACAGGVTLSMMAPFLMREPTRRQRERTLLVLLLPSLGATLLTEVLHGHGPLGDSMFLVLVFVCFLFGPSRPRNIGIGLVAIVTTYVGLYLELPRSTLPIQLASQVLILPVIWLACFAVVPMDPARTLRLAAGAVQARVARVLRLAATQDDEAALRRAVLRLNEAALAADDQLALLPLLESGPVRTALTAVELWTARLIEALRAQPVHRHHRRRLHLHARRIARGRRYISPAGDNAGDAALAALNTAVHRFTAAARVTRLNTTPAIQAAAPAGPLAWQMAIRNTLAAALAMAGGMALSPQRWFWAVITVYVVFLNARSRGDTMFKGAQRVAGTVLGIVSGLLLALSVAGDPWPESLLLLVSVFGMYYFFLVSYTVGIFFVTVMLGLLYGMLGTPLEQVLLLRLEETAIGVVAAVVVAAFVFPSRTREQVRLSGLLVVARLEAVVRSTRDALAGQPDATPNLAMRQVDRQVADLKLALAPLAARRILFRRSAVERPVPALMDCVHWARLLASEVPEGNVPDTTLVELDDLAHRLAALANGLAPPATRVPSASQSVLDGVIARLDGAVTILAEKVEIGGTDAFALHA